MAILKDILNWIKANPVNVACVVIMLAGISSLFWLIMPARAKSREGLKDKARQFQQVQGLINNRVTVPHNDPDEPTTQISLTVNENVVKEMGKVYDRMTDNFDRLSKRVVAINRDGKGGVFAHKPLVEGYFPEADPIQRFTVRDNYKAGLLKLHARLKAGAPPRTADLMPKVSRGANEIPPSTKEEAEALLQKQADKYIEEIKKSVSAYQVYTLPAPTTLTPQAAGWIFTISPAAFAEEPTPAQLWEAQMNLWIQEDIVNAIVQANTKKAGSVLSNPVKMLRKIVVEPRYVGLMLRTPEGGEPTIHDPNAPLPNDFRSSPTGRVCNGLYDVRQATVTMVVDLAQLPAVLNAFSQANLLSPIVQNITVVNQEKALEANNMIFGNGIDVAEVELLVQSLWMRRWTAGHDSPEQAAELAETFDPGLMPDAVRWQLGLPTRDPDYAPKPTDGQGLQIQDGGFDDGDELIDEFGP